jgi:iron complex transport system substrate-binding protein
MGSVNAVSTLVGTDSYSNYPHSVAEARMRGDITTVGDYVFPSYEMIMSTRPDMVFCDGSLPSHWDVSERLRRSDVSTIVLYAGESIETILDNIHIVGFALGYDMISRDVAARLETAQKDIFAMLGGNAETVRTMLSLSPDKSPWVSGRYTYVDDVSLAVLGENSMPAGFYGWVQATSSQIAASNPSVVIIMSYDYAATQSEYDIMMDSLSREWQFTDAYRDGKIYLFCGDLAEMTSRPGPRYAQLMELIAMILHPNAFPGDLPKYIGGEYEEYITITKYMGFNG